MWKAFIAFLVFAFAALAQAPNCQHTATFTSATPETAWANKPTATGGTPCLYWEYMYWTQGATGVSVQIEGTNDVAGSAGASFTALTATVGTANPATGTNQGAAVLCCDYYPWLRMNPTTFTGSGLSMTVRVYGWYTQPVSAGGGGGPTSNVNVQQWGGTSTSLGQKTMAASVPVVVASNQSNLPTNTVQLGGVAIDANSNGDAGVINSCTTFALFNLSGSGNTQIVAASAAKKIIVCSVDFATGTPEDVKFTEGTGSNCASGTADVTGLYKNISARSHDAMGLSYTATAGDALCLNQANSQALGGTIWYRYQ